MAVKTGREPTFVRVARPYPDLDVVFPNCGRCGKRLRRQQFYWCSVKCCAYASWWRVALRKYWNTPSLKLRDD